ncbi:TetR family transcriptional regulator [Pseudoclavibacter endophyticus]|uniref:TetR/AcrR family transcriptional regulator n=1 Tax=Pseudoclavibacter endophyticus TaxID=1778590 RepID=A0A6H9WU14_9MICO|nr:TetR/AcrR family transcriptional regulator [Pseudoclavibacter endophyticus]KAB1650357.1 TetR/AcrR family transcriptional regulator [Pseudoclavibacter endophyticus]GGA54857.1 TetR family transcriptional regulator [Pseudoclavibacter endophyticus]
MQEPRSRYHHGDLRASLIATGLELTRTGGPDALRLREVARWVGVSPNAAYRHFANHQALIAAVAAEVQDRMAQGMRKQAATDHVESPAARSVARLRGVGLGYVGFALEEPGWFRLAFFAPGDVERPDGRMPPPLTLLHEALDDLAAAGVIDSKRRKGAEWSCWSTVHGLAELAIHGPLRHLPRDEARAIAERAVDDIIAGVLRP